MIALPCILYSMDLTVLNLAVPALSADLKPSASELLWIIERNDELIEAIDNVAGGNTRRALDFVRDFFGSGHVDTAKIVERVAETGSYLVPVHELMRAVIYGDAAYYDAAQSPIANLFDVSSRDSKEHFCLPALLNLVMAAATARAVGGFVRRSEINAGMQNLSFTPEQIDFALDRALEKGLVQASPVGEAGLTDKSFVRIAVSGAYHVQRLMGTFVYLDAVVVATPVLMDAYRSKILDALPIERRLDRAEVFREYLDEQWKASGLIADAAPWPEASVALVRELAKIRVRVDRR